MIQFILDIFYYIGIFFAGLSSGIGLYLTWHFVLFGGHTIKDEKRIWSGIIQNKKKDGGTYIVQTYIMPILYTYYRDWETDRKSVV